MLVDVWKTTVICRACLVRSVPAISVPDISWALQRKTHVSPKWLWQWPCKQQWPESYKENNWRSHGQKQTFVNDQLVKYAWIQFICRECYNLNFIIQYVQVIGFWDKYNTLYKLAPESRLYNTNPIITWNQCLKYFWSDEK